MNYELFKNSTLEHNSFKIIDVDGDNKCFYRAIVNNMIHRSEITTNPFTLINKRSFRVVKNVNNDETVDIEYLDKARFSLEIKTLGWLDKHRDEIFPELGIKMREIVEIMKYHLIYIYGVI